jgi:hypothetical protein
MNRLHGWRECAKRQGGLSLRDDVDDTTASDEMMEVSSIVQRTSYYSSTEPRNVSERSCRKRRDVLEEPLD